MSKHHGPVEREVAPNFPGARENLGNGLSGVRGSDVQCAESGKVNRCGGSRDGDPLRQFGLDLQT